MNKSILLRLLTVLIITFLVLSAAIFSTGISSANNNVIYSGFFTNPHLIKNDTSIVFNQDELGCTFEKLNKELLRLEGIRKGMEIDLSDLKVEMKKFKSFLKEMKSELLKDGYINKDDDGFEMDFTKDRLIINGQRLPNDLLEKYKELYKKHFGREIENEFRMKK